MAMRDELRNLIRDNGTPPHFTDSELDSYLELALIDLNIWASTSYANIAALEAIMGASPSVEDKKVYTLTLMYAQILCLKADSSFFDAYVKVVTQDTTIDPGDAGTRLDKVLKELKKDFELRLKKWIGIDDGALIWATAAATEF